MSPAENRPGRFEIQSEAALQFHFLMFDKEMVFKSFDRVRDDLVLDRFVYDYTLDGNRQELTGRVMNGRLELEIAEQSQTIQETMPLEGKLYPTSVIGLYPAYHGLEVGRHYQYQIYDGQTNSIGTVTQDILAYEESDLFSGKAFKVSTRLHGQEVTTWIDAKGLPLLEFSLGGVIISGLESEVVAKQYLAQAGMNKDETLLRFSLVKAGTPLQTPEKVSSMEIALGGMGETFNMPSDGLQQCARRGEEIICTIRSEASGDGNGSVRRKPKDRYLKPTHAVPSQNQLICETAQNIAGKGGTSVTQAQRLVRWIQDNIQQEPIDVFTALDVLSKRKGECQGHAYLYAAFARALEIPTRVVNGIVYAEDYQGFLYHTWAESHMDGCWVRVDPTLGQLPADATHVKIIEGEDLLDLLPLTNLIGRLQLRLIAVNGP